jgi:hypothetical protein
MAHELDHDHQLPRHRGALPPARSRAVSLLLLIPGRRSARGRRARHAECRACSHLRDGCRAFRAPGSATCRSAPLSVRKVAPPDKLRELIGSGALWSAGTRAHAPAALRLRGAQPFLKARALCIRSYAPLRPGIRLPAPPRPGWTARRACTGHHAARRVATPVARRTPARRRAWPVRRQTRAGRRRRAHTLATSWCREQTSCRRRGMNSRREPMNCRRPPRPPRRVPRPRALHAA